MKMKWKQDKRNLTFPDGDLNPKFLNKFPPKIWILREIRSIELKVLKKILTLRKGLFVHYFIYERCLLIWNHRHNISNVKWNIKKEWGMPISPPQLNSICLKTESIFCITYVHKLFKIFFKILGKSLHS